MDVGHVCSVKIENVIEKGEVAMFVHPIFDSP